MVIYSFCEKRGGGEGLVSKGLILYRARTCKPFKEPKNRFPAWRAGTTNVYKYGLFTRKKEAPRRRRTVTSLNELSNDRIENMVAVRGEALHRPTPPLSSKAYG